MRCRHTVCARCICMVCMGASTLLDERVLPTTNVLQAHVRVPDAHIACLGASILVDECVLPTNIVLQAHVCAPDAHA